MGKFDDGSLTEWSGRDSDHVLGVVNGDDNSSGELDFLPGFFDVNKMYSVFFSSNIRFHFIYTILSTNVTLGKINDIERWRVR